ncbi:suppressor of fused domain protein [Saccharothrix deserti]|uniref:suppressor of fused domain protein n=1 Tax=Saccharothrix deserti TaxID=2593674 RepID=UPI0013915003|nr:suppressor of fused domain protein [Saccharothrix deserti]
MRIGRKKEAGGGSRAAVGRHLEKHLGKPISRMTAKVADRTRIDLLRYADAPWKGQTTLVTNGLADYAREHAFAADGGYAQELLMVLRADYVTEQSLDFFARNGDLCTRQHRLLSACFSHCGTRRWKRPGDWESTRSTNKWRGSTRKSETCADRRCGCGRDPGGGVRVVWVARCRPWSGRGSRGGRCRRGG